MSLLFLHFCDLFESLEGVSRHDPPLLPAERNRRNADIIRGWFASHKAKVQPQVLLSALFPARRTDRVYLVQCKRLSRQLGRFLFLGHARFQELNKYLVPGYGDLGECIERVQRQSEFSDPPASRAVTLQQVEDALDKLASRSSFSGKEVQACALDVDRNVMTLGDIYKSLQSREMKWMTRLLLKDLNTVDLNPYADLVYSCIDPRLAMAMQMHDNFSDAVKALSNVQPAPRVSNLVPDDSKMLIPQVGVKVGPARWVKAQGGVDHALSLIGRKTMSLERKYDGEYCQIHVDLDRSAEIIRIFSKSGKDSTEDRKKVLPAVKCGLRIGETNQNFARTCILEGELVVWSDRENTILDFHKVRKHVVRSGHHIGTKEDSQPHSWEHLMVIFYDLLLLDDDAVIHRSQADRRWLLEQVVKPIDGRITLADQVQVDFSNCGGPVTLKRRLAEAFANRWEGLVLKPAAEPYFGPATGPPGSRSPWIKLKKDCIAGIGDTADFAVVGAGYDAVRAQQLNLDNIRWTHFFLGCLKNKIAVLERNATPAFLVVDCVTSCISHDDFRSLNQQGAFSAQEHGVASMSPRMELEFVSIDSRLPVMTTTFYEPFVFDVAGSGFERASNRRIYTLRFPRVLKVRWDTDWREAVDLDGLQAMAAEARNPPNGTLEEEVARFIKEVESSSKTLTSAAEQQQSSNENLESSPEQCKVGVDHMRRRVRKNLPPLIRMDTNEMQDGDQRHLNGEGSISPWNSSSATPGKSAHQRTDAERDNSDAITTSIKRKRQTPNIFAMPGQSFSAPWDSTPWEPLREVTDMANVHPSNMDPQQNISGLVGERYLDLVKKHAIGIEAPSRNSKRREIRYLRSSPDPAMTTDEDSSAASTQIRTLYAVASQPETKRGQGHVSASGLITPPSTAEVKDPIILPDLKTCVAFMDNSRPPSDGLRRFYGQNRQYLKRVLRSIYDLWTQGEKFTSIGPKAVVFLVDSKDALRATQEILDVTACMLKIRRTIRIWDWRILRKLFGEGENVQPDQQCWKRSFLASMEFSGLPDDNQTKRISVKWRDGVTEYVSRSKAERLGQDLEERMEKLAEKLRKADAG